MPGRRLRAVRAQGPQPRRSHTDRRASEPRRARGENSGAGRHAGRSGRGARCARNRGGERSAVRAGDRKRGPRNRNGCGAHARGAADAEARRASRRESRGPLLVRPVAQRRGFPRRRRGDARGARGPPLRLRRRDLRSPEPRADPQRGVRGHRRGDRAGPRARCGIRGRASGRAGGVRVRGQDGRRAGRRAREGALGTRRAAAAGIEPQRSLLRVSQCRGLRFRSMMIVRAFEMRTDQTTGGTMITLKALVTASAIALLATVPGLAQQQVAPPVTPYGTPISLEAAKKAMAAAEAEAAKNNWLMAIAILDSTGHMVMLHKMDNTQYGSIAAAEGKARTAIDFRRPSKVFEDAVAEGGIPIAVDGKIVGSIGVSGALSAQDAQVARAGADAVK